MELTEPLPFITLTDDDCFEISRDAAEYLRSLEGEVSIVAIAGLYRTGKSYLLNQLLGRTTEHTMFGVGGTVNAMTKGIWIWGQPVDGSTRKTIVFMDTEGLGSAQRSQTQDTRIFALALLLSSFFIYNSRGVIDANAIEDLSLVVNLTKYIHVSAASLDQPANSSALADFFPSFLWVVRDFTLQLEENGHAISSKEYLEKALKPQPGTSDDTVHKNQVRNLLSNFFPARDCITMVRPLNDEALLRELPKQPFESLREEFRTQLTMLKQRVFSDLQPKKLMAKPLNGAMLVTLAQNYVDAFNSGAAPVISSAWDRVVQAQSEELLDAAKRTFETKFPLKWTSVLTEAALLDQFRAAQAAAVESLHATAVAPDTVPINLPLLHDYVATKLRAAWDLNDKLAKQHLITVLQELYAPITAQAWQPLDKDATFDQVVDALRKKLDGFDTLLKRFITSYLERTGGMPLQHSMLCSFLAEKVAYATSRPHWLSIAGPLDDSGAGQRIVWDLFLNLVGVMMLLPGHHFVQNSIGGFKRVDASAGNACASCFFGWSTLVDPDVLLQVMDGVVNWGTLVTVLFRQQDSAMQVLSVAVGRVITLRGSAQEMLQQQKDTFERALQAITDRLQEEKLALRADIDHKDGEIKRTLMQIDRIGALHTEVLDRLNDELKVAKEELKAADALVDAVRREQDSVAQDTAKQRLENERRQHAKEQELLHGHHQLLQKVVDLERALGDQQSEHLTAVFKMEQTCQAHVRRVVEDCDDAAAELKAHTIHDIRQLKTKQEGELRALTTELDDRQAVLTAMQERLEMQRRVNMSAASAKRSTKEDCVVS
ncbi:hypothetical protein DYB32_007968 [Aphanomyces invadans]|uniref:GB1/RHD3-type G domain-containing protein n=1 Tax=Aphanomyces invadans TaxID=157072 RepID=A0A418AMI5_9STRA|nr:hypothetical protein DYB32_007968 [Aphanomyces invadans]